MSFLGNFITARRYTNRWSVPYRARTMAGTKRRAGSIRPGYGGTKRRRITRRWNRGRPFKRRGATRRRMPMYKPVRLGLNQPVRAIVKHTNVISVATSNQTGAFSRLIKTFLPLKLSDFDTTVETGRYPMNYTDYARMFNNYRVHGFKITAYFSDMDNDTNDQFISCFYSVPGINDGTQPSDPYSVTSLSSTNAFLQEKGIRKHLIVGNGANNSARRTIHSSGYWDMKRIQSDLQTDAHISEGEVNADGTDKDEPFLKPLIIHKTIASPHAGWAATHGFSVRYHITAYVEWFNRRRIFEGERTEV